VRAFELPETHQDLRGQYPGAQPLGEALRVSSPRELRWIICQWLSEGVPYAFEDRPLLYEAARAYLANQLGLHPKQITLVGSARIGYSLAPPPNYGRGFSSCSDIYLAAICGVLFESCRGAFNRWLGDYTDGRVKPRNPNETRYWRDHAVRVPQNLRRGFVDHWKIPFWGRYPEAQTIEEGAQRLGRKLRISGGAPGFTKVSLRVYRDWDAFVNQRWLNLARALARA